MGPAAATKTFTVALRDRPAPTGSHTFYATLVLVIATLAVYYPAHRYPFFNIDDGPYVTQNSHVLAPLDWAEVKWAFTHSYCSYYDPLIFLAHSLNVRMFELD